MTEQESMKIWLAKVDKAIHGFIKPCPCCGAKYSKSDYMVAKGLYIGPESATSYSVKCFHCGLRMIVQLPEEWNRDVDIEVYCMEEALKKWNKRT